MGRDSFWSTPNSANRVSNRLGPEAPATGVSGGVVHAVVGQHRRGMTMLTCGFAKRRHDSAAIHDNERGDIEGVAGVVIEPRQHLHVGVVGETDMGHVCLPHLVGEIGLEPDVGRLRSLLRCGLDEPGTVQDPSDRGRRHRHVVASLEVPADRFRARVETLRGEGSSSLDDQLDHLRWGRVRRRPRSPRSWFERGVAFEPIAGDQFRDPAARHAIQARRVRLRKALDLDSQDDRSTLRHRPRSPSKCFLCLATRVSDVLTHHTPSDTVVLSRDIGTFRTLGSGGFFIFRWGLVVGSRGWGRG